MGKRGSVAEAVARPQPGELVGPPGCQPQLRDAAGQKLRWTRTWPTTVFWSLNWYSAVGCGALGVKTELPDMCW
jgi:hypothetical protein